MNNQTKKNLIERLINIDDKLLKYKLNKLKKVDLISLIERLESKKLFEDLSDDEDDEEKVEEKVDEKVEEEVLPTTTYESVETEEIKPVIKLDKLNRKELKDLYLTDFNMEIRQIIIDFENEMILVDELILDYQYILGILINDLNNYIGNLNLSDTDYDYVDALIQIQSKKIQKFL